jgi:hypothetical protein
VRFLGLPRKTVDEFCPIQSGMRCRQSLDGSSTLTVVLVAHGRRYAYLSPFGVQGTTEDFWAHGAGAPGFYTRGQDLFPTPLTREVPAR